MNTPFQNFKNKNKITITFIMVIALILTSLQMALQQK